MKKFFVFLIIIAGCLFLLYKIGYLPIDTIKAQVMSQMPVNNSSIVGNTQQATTQAVESQKSLMPEGNKGMEEQVIGDVVGAVREGNALIEGVRLYDKGVLTNDTYSEGVKKISAFFGKPELHIITAYYSTTLNKTVLIDNNLQKGSRLFYDVDSGKDFYREGEGFKDTPAEQSLQTYVAMKGLANAIDGK